MRDKIESLPITSRAGNDRNAGFGVAGLHGDLTISHHEGCVSTMLTVRALSIARPRRDFKQKTQSNTTKLSSMGLFVLTARHP